MGCLNSNKSFTHWFGNIHLSGPCNRSCYFCIGQHMMALDPLNTLDASPLPGFDRFVERCRERGIGEVNLTGSNTDPLLYRHHWKLHDALKQAIPGVTLGIRTNGALLLESGDILDCYDKWSVSITSLDPDLYRKTMGSGKPPNILRIMEALPRTPVKVNVVLCPETVESGDIYRTLDRLAAAGVHTVNLREPYGQPHIGSPLKNPCGTVYGMPQYRWGAGTMVTYWDVHYCEVESVNLYANGTVSEDYPVTRGHHPSGEVIGQESWLVSGRHREQWVKLTTPNDNASSAIHHAVVP